MRHRGLMLLEVLWAIMLLGMIAVIVARVFTQSLQGIGDQQLRHWHDSAERSLLAQLRSDVWTSTGAAVADNELRLQSPAGQITYRIEEQHVLRIMPGESDGRWERSGPVQFAATGGLITLQMPARSITFVAPIVGQGGAQ